MRPRDRLKDFVNLSVTLSENGSSALSTWNFSTESNTLDLDKLLLSDLAGKLTHLLTLLLTTGVQRLGPTVGLRAFRPRFTAATFLRRLWK